MTEKEARQLKPGDQVIFADGIKGEVLAANQHCIEIDWKDGAHGYISPLDCDSLSHLTEAK